MLRPILQLILLATTLSACAGTPPPQDSSAPAELAIRDVTVVDVARGTLLPHRTVLVNAGRITAVLPAQPGDPPAQTAVDGRGAYLIPGLWDMHVHLTLNAAPAEFDMPLMVANGVLGVREMVSDCPEWTWLRRRAGVDCLTQIRAWQQAIEAGDLLGPRILATGSWIVDDPDYVSLDAPEYFHMDSPERGRRLAEHYEEVGVDFVKIYSGVSPAGFSALVEHARQLGLDVAGHAPLTISAIEASEAGQRSFEHARVFLFN